MIGGTCARDLFRNRAILKPKKSSAVDEVEALRQENAALRAQIVWLKQKLFGGAKSEKLDQAQLRFQLEELEKLAAKTEERVETITYERSKAAKEPRQVPADAGAAGAKGIRNSANSIGRFAAVVRWAFATQPANVA